VIEFYKNNSASVKR